MSEFLQTMVAASRQRAAQIKGRPGGNFSSRSVSARPAFPLRLDGPGFDLIAEAKLASPRDGRLVESDEPIETVTGLARSYERAGAAAVSVLTEPSRFHGALGHLTAVSEATGLPVLRKDFLVDPIQVYESKASGASGLLLIARILEPGLLTEMVDLSLDLGMFVLLEVFEPKDLERASRVFDREILIGVNGRDLTTLEVDSHRLDSMAPLLPAQLPAVAESGITSPEDAAAAARLGYRAALVGTGLVTTTDPEATAAGLVEAGRGAIRLGTT